MNKRQEAVGKYIADFVRTLGIGLMLFAIIGIAMDREEVLANIAGTVTFLVIGGVLVVVGVIIVLLSTISD